MSALAKSSAKRNRLYTEWYACIPDSVQAAFFLCGVSRDRVEAYMQKTRPYGFSIRTSLMRIIAFCCETLPVYSFLFR